MVFRGGRTISRKVEMRGTYGVLHLGSSEFLFDAEDLPLIESRNWYRDKDGYLVSCYYFSGVRRFVRFHRIVMKATSQQIVDHINKNRADNRMGRQYYLQQQKAASWPICFKRRCGKGPPVQRGRTVSGVCAAKGLVCSKVSRVAVITHSYIPRSIRHGESYKRSAIV